eukprot:g6467.t1
MNPEKMSGSKFARRFRLRQGITSTGTLSENEEQKMNRLYNKRIRKAKPSVDNSTPMTEFRKSKLVANRKANAKVKRRREEIANQNYHLLRRIRDIKRTPITLHDPKQAYFAEKARRDAKKRKAKQRAELRRKNLDMMKRLGKATNQDRRNAPEAGLPFDPEKPGTYPSRTDGTINRKQRRQKRKKEIQAMKARGKADKLRAEVEAAARKEKIDKDSVFMSSVEATFEAQFDKNDTYSDIEKYLLSAIQGAQAPFEFSAGSIKVAFTVKQTLSDVLRVWNEKNERFDKSLSLVKQAGDVEKGKELESKRTAKKLEKADIDEKIMTEIMTDFVINGKEKPPRGLSPPVMKVTLTVFSLSTDIKRLNRNKKKSKKKVNKKSTQSSGMVGYTTQQAEWLEARPPMAPPGNRRAGTVDGEDRYYPTVGITNKPSISRTVAASATSTAADHRKDKPRGKKGKLFDMGHVAGDLGYESPHFPSKIPNFNKKRNRKIQAELDVYFTSKRKGKKEKHCKNRKRKKAIWAEKNGRGSFNAVNKNSPPRPLEWNLLGHNKSGKPAASPYNKARQIELANIAREEEKIAEEAMQKQTWARYPKVMGGLGLLSPSIDETAGFENKGTSKDKKIVTTNRTSTMRRNKVAVMPKLTTSMLHRVLFDPTAGPPVDVQQYQDRMQGPGRLRTKIGIGDVKEWKDTELREVVLFCETLKIPNMTSDGLFDEQNTTFDEWEITMIDLGSQEYNLQRTAGILIRGTCLTEKIERLVSMNELEVLCGDIIVFQSAMESVKVLLSEGSPFRLCNLYQTQALDEALFIAIRDRLFPMLACRRAAGKTEFVLLKKGYPWQEFDKYNKAAISMQACGRGRITRVQMRYQSDSNQNAAKVVQRNSTR